MSTGSSGYLEPKISVCTQSKSIGLFNGFECVRAFQPYTIESEAIREAHDWFRGKTICVPQVVFPIIKKVKLTS